MAIHHSDSSDKHNELNFRIKKSIFNRPNSFLTLFGTIIGIISMIATIIGLTSASAKTEITTQILSCDELTKYSSVAELKGTFSYAGENVTHLWKTTIRIVNSGENSLIGKGNYKNILGDGLELYLPPNIRVLKCEDEFNTVDAVINKFDNHCLITFEQWRKEEYVTLAFYSTSDDELTEAPIPVIDARQIIDGEIVVENLLQPSNEQNLRITDQLPILLVNIGNIIGSFILGFVVLLLSFLMIGSWITYIQAKSWKNKYMSKYNEFIDSFPESISDSSESTIDYWLTPEEKSEYTNNPNNFNHWNSNNWQYPKYPSTLFESFISNVSFSIGSLITIFGLTVVWLNILHLNS